MIKLKQNIIEKEKKITDLTKELVFFLIKHDLNNFFGLGRIKRERNRKSRYHAFRKGEL